MADSSVPFALGAASVPLVENLVDIPVGQSAQIDLLVSDLLSTDDPTSMTLAVKVSADASDLATTTILKTITQSLTAAGVITPTNDPTVWRAVFTLTRQEGVRISRSTTYEYSVVATVDRGGTDYTRMVQRGAIRTTLYPIDNDAPLANGAYFADGSIHASGFDN
jgi:hypothetical protein